MARSQKKVALSTSTKVLLILGALTSVLTFSGIARIAAEALGISSYPSWGGLIQWPGLIAMLVGSYMASQERKAQRDPGAGDKPQ